MSSKPMISLGASSKNRLWELLGAHGAGPRVCEPGLEPQLTPNRTFLSPNGSPCHHFGHPDRGSACFFGADLARGVPPPQSQLFFPTMCDPETHFLVRKNRRRPRPRVTRAWGPHGAPSGPSGALNLPQKGSILAQKSIKHQKWSESGPYGSV